MTKLLKAKHWQLFLLVIGLPVLSNYILKYQNIEEAYLWLLLTPLLFICGGYCYILWLWSITNGLRKQFPSNFTIGKVKLKLLFLLPASYIFSFSLILGSLMVGLLESSSSNIGLDLLNRKDLIYIIAHCISSICLIYISFIASQIIRSIELKKKSKFSEFFSEFILILFFPIGIWFIQPRINSIMNG